MNVGMLRSGRCDYVENDTRSVVEAAGEVKAAGGVCDSRNIKPEKDFA